MLRALAQRIWRVVKRFEARVLIGLALTAGSLWAFLSIAEEMGEGETDAIDRHLILMLRNPADLSDPIGSQNVEEAVRDLTALGGTVQIALVTLLAVLAFAFHRKYKHALVMSGAVLLAWLSSDAGKMVFDRPRPDLVPHGAYVYSASFPSGHSTLAAATYLTLGMLVASLESRRRSKGLAYGVAVVLLGAVGFSRVYLGVHWPSDVLAGWCLGATWALAGWIALRLMHAPTRGD